MPSLEAPVLVLIAAGLIGAAFGVLAVRSQFCLVSGVRDTVEGRASGKLAAFAAAALAAIAGTQALAGAGLLDLSGVTYLPASGSAIGVAIGGVLFGLGAVAARGCLGRLTVLSATGNLRALVVIMVAGVAAYATMRGVLVLPRSGLQAIGANGAGAIDLAARAAALAGVEISAVRFAAAILAGAAALALVLTGMQRGRILAGAAIGLLVAAGWAATGILGADDFDPAPVQSLTFAAPLGTGLVYLMTATGARVDFGIVVLAGVLVGSGVTARLAGAARLQGFEGPGQMARYLGGAVLMGFGAVTALGCTTGQGLTGLSTLAPLSIVALTAMVAGLRAGFAIEAWSERRAAPRLQPAE